MGKGKKNKKKSFYKKSVAPLLTDNRIWMAALGGVAAGITLAGIFGGEKAKQILNKVSDAARDITEKVKDSLDSDLSSNKANNKRQLADKQPA